MQKRPTSAEVGRFSRSQALGRLPWLALFPLRERRLRPRLDIAALLSLPVGPQTLVLAGRDDGARIVRSVAGTAKLTLYSLSRRAPAACRAGEC